MSKELEVQTKQLQDFTDKEFSLIIPELNLSMDKAIKIPLAEVQSLGIAFKPLTQAVQSIASGGGGSGIYYVDTKGMQMFTRQGTNKYIGSLKNANGSVGGGQATMTQIPLDPTMLFVAATLMSIEKKLDSIQEMQQDILLFLEQKEKAKLQGDMNVLTDVLNNYKYNFDNEKYKNNKHILVQEIKRNSEHSMLLYREQIEHKISKRNLIHADNDVKNTLNKLQYQFKDYQLALYLYAFSSFIEVLLLENYDSKYLKSISDRIEEYSFQYRNLYTDCYDIMENYSKSSVQSNIIKGLSKASTFAGNTVAKIPLINKTKIDESLVESGNKLSTYGTNKSDNALKDFITVSYSVVTPFVENINVINSLYNEETKYYIDSNTIYILKADNS